MSNLLDQTDSPSRAAHTKAQSDLGTAGLGTADALRAEIQAAIKAEDDKSLLRRGIDFIASPFHQEDAALSRLQSLESQGGSAAPSEIQGAIEQNRKAMQREQDSYSVLGSLAKGVGVFTRGRFGWIISATAGMLDETKTNSDNTFADLSLGAIKGLLERKAYQLMADRHLNPAIIGPGLGTSNRFFESALNRDTYTDPATGESSMLSGAGNILKTTFDPASLATDVATGLVAYPMLKMAPGLLTGNQFRTVATTSFIYGYAGGLTQELASEFKQGDLNPTRLVLFPLATGASSAVSAIPGAQRAYVDDWGYRNAINTRENEYRLVALDKNSVNAVRKNSDPVPVDIKPISPDGNYGESEKVRISSAKIPHDWISSANNVIFGRNRTPGAGDIQLRYISRPASQAGTDAPWQMVTDRTLQSVYSIMSRSPDWKYGLRQEFSPLIKNVHEPVRDALGSGAESHVMQLGDGAVLRLTSSLDPPEDWGKLYGDARLLSETVTRGPKRSEPKTLSVQELLRTPITKAQTRELDAEMAAHGVSWHDFNFHLEGEQVSSATHQAGTDATGKLKIHDYGSRRGPLKPWPNPATPSESTQ